MTDAKAAAVTERGVLLADGTMLAASTVVCTIGTMQNSLVERSPLLLDRGRIIVNADLAIPAIAGAWAIGDCARIRNARDGTMAPPTAQFAIREAQCVAGNVLATIHGRGTRPFHYRQRGSMATVGQRRGVAEIFGVPLWGFAAWLLWRAYYLSQMPTFGRKLRIFVDWTWAALFPTDITHLRFHRSADLPQPRARPPSEPARSPAFKRS